VEALKIIAPLKNDIQVITYPAEMGEDECREAGFEPIVIGSIKSGETGPMIPCRQRRKWLSAAWI
jgi:hypothetical protein